MKDTNIDVEKYIRDLTWSKDASDYEKTLVAGNIRGFAVWLAQELDFEINGDDSDNYHPGRPSE